MNNGDQRYYFLVTLKNRRKRTPVRNCQVELRRLVEIVNDEPRPLRLSSALPFAWSYRHELTFSPALTFIDQADFDLGFIEMRNSRFAPAIHHDRFPNDFAGYAKHGQVIRYYLQVAAENALWEQHAVYEVKLPKSVEWKNRLQGEELEAAIRNQHIVKRVYPEDA